MATFDEKLVSQVVSEVLTRLRTDRTLTPAAPSARQGGEFGIYEDMGAACAAAAISFQKLREAGVSSRKKAVAAIRRLCRSSP